MAITGAQQAYVNEALAHGYAQSDIDLFVANNPGDYARILSALAPNPGPGGASHPAVTDPLINILPYGGPTQAAIDPNALMLIKGGDPYRPDGGPVATTNGYDPSGGRGFLGPVTNGATPPAGASMGAGGIASFLSQNLLLVAAVAAVAFYLLTRKG